MNGILIEQYQEFERLQQNPFVTCFWTLLISQMFFTWDSYGKKAMLISVSVLMVLEARLLTSSLKRGSGQACGKRNAIVRTFPGIQGSGSSRYSSWRIQAQADNPSSQTRYCLHVDRLRWCGERLSPPIVAEILSICDRQHSLCVTAGYESASPASQGMLFEGENGTVHLPKWD